VSTLGHPHKQSFKVSRGHARILFWWLVAGNKFGRRVWLLSLLLIAVDIS
jgi:hypothetical protein